MAGPPSEQEELITRMVNKIAELEAKLYQTDLDAPAVIFEPLVTQAAPENGASSFLSSFKERLNTAYPSAFNNSPSPGPVTTSATIAATATTSTPVPPTSPAAEWFSALWKKDQRVSEEGAPAAAESSWFGSRSDAASNGSSHALPQDSASGTVQKEEPDWTNNGSYYRYVFDPVDVEAEMEVNAKVRKAAAEALMEAEAKLAASEEGGRRMLEQLEQYQTLHEEVQRLKSERDVALGHRKEIEDEAITVRSQLEGMQVASHSLQEELEGLRKQATIWQGGNLDEREKYERENKLLRSQMQTRLNELSATKSKLTEADAERQRLVRDLDDAGSKLQWLQKINGQLETSAQQLESVRKQAAEYQEKFMKERNVRRKLHEQLQVLKGNIRVMCRVRPPLADQKSIVAFPLEGLLSLAPADRRPHEFEFDHVFGPDSPQVDVFNEVSSLVRSCADGFNICIFAYGQTGSGKTFTMEGPSNNPGINFRVMQELFSIAAEEGRLDGWEVCVSMVEIYNDAVHDLLRPPSEVMKPMDVSGLGPGELPAGVDRIPGVVWRSVSCADGVKQVLRDGSKNRATASTALNQHSSRSHCAVSIKVSLPSPCGTEGRKRESMVHLVDLAGSERVDKSEVTGQQLKEAQSINKSLSALGDVISALQRRGAHIPFRNSKLTQVLQDSLSGSSKVMLVCNISPEAGSASETLSSLNFASRAAQVELGQARRVVERTSLHALPISPMPERPGSTSGRGSGSNSGTPLSMRPSKSSQSSAKHA